jgi:hypothetical protein
MVRPPAGDVMQLSSPVPSSLLSWGRDRGHRGQELGRRGRGLGHRSRGRGWRLGHRDRGHRLEVEVGEVEAARSMRSRVRSRSLRSMSPPWGRGRWGRSRGVGEVKGEVEGAEVEVIALRERSRPWGRGWGLGHRGRGHPLEATVGEVEATRWVRSPPWGQSRWGRGREFEGEVTG